ncbi:hypothetical protein, partial [Acerihabitans arboris]|uniref:hypothetical protein n=1 Tax=Acerihabitans arboris TaxID=2691583 RepID=UPI001C49A4D5
EVADAMETLIKAIPVSTPSFLSDASAPGNARPAEGAIPGVAMARKTRVSQTENVQAMLSAKGASQSLASPGSGLAEEILRNARANLKPIPPQSAHSTKSDPMAESLNKARTNLKSGVQLPAYFWHKVKPIDDIANAVTEAKPIADREKTANGK